MSKRLLPLSLCGVALLAAACGSTMSATSSTTTATSTTAAPTSTSTSTSTMGSQITVSSPDDATETALVAAGAAANGLVPADYVGLSEGTVYYAVDGSTGYAYAGASMVPSASSTAAQVASQDEGSYLIFAQAPGQAWKVVARTGLHATCPADVPPAAVVAAWGWTVGTCAPSSY